MKKILFFAFALVASALVITSCNNSKRGPSDPAKKIIGTWSRDTEKSEEGYYETQTLIIEADKNFAFNGEQHDPQNPDFIAIMLLEGKYEVSGDTLLVHFERHGWNYNGEIEYIPDWEGRDEKMKFTVTGSELTLVHNYGGEYEGEPEIYTRK